MAKSKLLLVLENLTPSELDQLDLFLQSPFLTAGYRNPKKIHELFAILIQGKKLVVTEIDKKVVHAQLFLDQAFNEGRIDKLISAFFKLLESFVFYMDAKEVNGDFKRLIALGNFYQKKGLDRLLENTMSKVSKIQKQIKRKGIQDLLNDFVLENKKSELKSLSNPRDLDLNLEKAILSLDKYFIATRLDLSNSLFAQNSFHNKKSIEESVDFLPSIRDYSESRSFLQEPIIKCYLLVGEILSNPNENFLAAQEAIENLESILVEYQDSLPNNKIKEFHSLSRSFYMRLINLGNRNFIADGYALYKNHLASGVLLEDNAIHSASFKNMVWLGIRMKDYDGVLTFINSMRDRIIGTNYPEEVYKYNLARFYFHKGDIKKADECLSYEFEDLYYILSVRRLEIMILYHQNQDLLDYKLNAFKIFIHRISKKQLPEIFILGNKNFVNFLKQILSPSNVAKSKKEKIAEKISSTATVLEKEWLIRILN